LINGEGLKVLISILRDPSKDSNAVVWLSGMEEALVKVKQCCIKIY